MNQQSLPSLELRTAQSGAMSVDEFCRWACIGKTKTYAEAKAGRLLLRKIGSKTVVLRVDAEQWLSSLPAARTTI
uniref:DNA-binding protein n=1 Tax=Bradyrhizobium sp. (strain ORS 278) TaxID=114615 RepID=UPI0012FEF094|nr:DNA-binding protein [Bradyrhizobium sp. ORS 278]